MASYSFVELLSPLDFEHLARDILSRDLKVDLKTFAEGKDKGVDLRYSKNADESIIVQCKRVKSISKKLLEEEKEKIEKLNPTKYFLVLAIDISTELTDFITETFCDWMEDDSNIYTKSRLNNLLDEYIDIHQKQYKLWLNSSTIFNRIISQPLFERAKSLISDLKRDYKYYVKNESLNKAFEILNENQFIIISGIPGIGKTTLAKLILWEYLQKDFEIIEIRKISEGEQVLIENSELNQVFYFDDFLGENFLKYDVIEGRANDLVQFLKRIKNSKNKKLVMTTREYILNQAKETYEKLDSPELNIVKYTLDLSSYSKRIKALILYNHLFYSGIPIEYINALIENKTYEKIIEHKNYSPRIIEQLTIKLSDILISDYSTEFINSLDYPLGIWDKAFQSQISEGARFTLFSLVSFSERVLLSDFKIALDKLYKEGAKEKGVDFNPFYFKKYIKELENSFIKINITKKRNHFIAFQNPSIRDFLLNIIKHDEDIVKLLLSTCNYFNQFAYTLRYLANGFMDNKEIQNLSNNIIFNQFDLMSNCTRVSIALNEYKSEITTIEKIHDLKFYLKQTKNTELIDFIIDRFKSINIKNMFYTIERNYLEFYKEYYDRLSLNYTNITQQVFENMSWFGSVDNIEILEDINKEEFEIYKSTNEEFIQEKLSDTIRREIEFSDTEDALEDFKGRLDYSSSVLSRFTLSVSDFDNDFKIRKNEIIDKAEPENKKGTTDLEHIDVVSDDDDFNVDELFRIEMFT